MTPSSPIIYSEEIERQIGQGGRRGIDVAEGEGEAKDWSKDRELRLMQLICCF